MANPSQITIRIKLAWWVKPYLLALIAFAKMAGQEPDADKAAELISRRGLRFVQD